LNYLLDTNVISELRKGQKMHPSVQEWWSETDMQTVCISVLVLGEIRQGIERLRIKDPQKAHEIEHWLQLITRSLGARVLVVNQQIADIWGRMGIKRTLPLVDSVLAATALAHDLTLVTRNTKDIQNTGVRYLNPFKTRA
jgi:predicted nucleic acid-binding protein